MASPSTYDPVTNTKICSRCKLRQCVDNFYPNKLTREKRAPWCKDCTRKDATRRQQAYGPERIRARNLQLKYKMSVEEYDALFKAQKGLCAICGLPSPDETRLGVDHDHLSGKNRGLLCDPCNMAIGLLKDEVSRLQAAIEYLNRYRS